MLRIVLFLDFSCGRRSSRRDQPRQERPAAAMGHDATRTHVSCISGWTCYAVNQWTRKAPESGFLQVISLQGRRKDAFTMIIIKTFNTEAAEAL